MNTRLCKVFKVSLYRKALRVIMKDINNTEINYLKT